MKLFCAIVGAAGSTFEVDIAEDDSVSALKEVIQRKRKNALNGVDPDDLELFLAKKDNGGGAWLTENDVIKGATDTSGLTRLAVARAKLRCVGLSSDEVSKVDNEVDENDEAAGNGPVHLLVVVQEGTGGSASVGIHRHRARDEDLPLAKRVKFVEKEVAYQGPVPEEFYSVPMETIGTYQKLEIAFSRKVASLCLLYGPRQFGKTTIAYRLAVSLKADPSILVIYASLIPSTVETEESFWLALGRLVGEETKSLAEFEKMLSRRKTRLWLAIDEMDMMFKNEDLTRNFMYYLRMWQLSEYFLGFLGIGSHDLLNMHMKFKGGGTPGITVSPFNLVKVFQVKRFTTHQMSGFFQQIGDRYPFRDSTRQAIMSYSAGAPGVFGSLVRYSIDYEQFNVERHEWEDWFKIRSFSHYLDYYNWTYKKIREDLQELSQSDWDLLGLLLKDDVSGSSNESGTDRETLLRMGVVTTGAHETAKLEFSSEMMRRLCLEALPIREIRDVATADDPLELFAVSLRFVNPESIRHAYVKNKLSPSESVFHFELYASIRGIFKSNNISGKKILAEARDPLNMDKRRLGIIITNGEKYGYELKSNRLTESEIIAAVKQADGYRELLGIGTMFMVNFVPRGHVLKPPVYSVEKYPDVKIIHVFFPDTCNEYTLEYEGVMEPRTVRCA